MIDNPDGHSPECADVCGEVASDGLGPCARNAGHPDMHQTLDGRVYFAAPEMKAEGVEHRFERHPEAPWACVVCKQDEPECLGIKPEPAPTPEKAEEPLDYLVVATMLTQAIREHLPNCLRYMSSRDCKHMTGIVAYWAKRIAQPSGWQPIETAPRWERILLWWTTCKEPAIGRWETDESEKPFGARKGWWCDGDQCIPKNQEHCKFWMPLPEPPKCGGGCALEAGHKSGCFAPIGDPK